MPLYHPILQIKAFQGPLVLHCRYQASFVRSTNATEKKAPALKQPVTLGPKPMESVKAGGGTQKKPLSEAPPSEYRQRREAGEGMS